MTTYSWEAKFGDEVLDYEIDWTDRLAGRTISGSVTATATGNSALTVGAISTDGAVTIIRISGGGTKANNSGRINVLAPTSSGESIGETIRLPIMGR